MYTLYKDHLTWQQVLGHEVRDRVRFKDHVNYYDMRNHESNFEKVQSIKMKRVYGLHNPKYMGETPPVL